MEFGRSNARPSKVESYVIQIIHIVIRVTLFTQYMVSLEVKHFLNFELLTEGISHIFMAGKMRKVFGKSKQLGISRIFIKRNNWYTIGELVSKRVLVIVNKHHILEIPFLEYGEVLYIY